EALGIGLHQAVLDAVMHHLDVVPGAHRAHVGIAVGWRERLEERSDALDDLRGTTSHDAEPLLQPPDPAGYTGIDEVDAALRKRSAAADRVPVVGVSALDHRIAPLQRLRERA